MVWVSVEPVEGGGPVALVDLDISDLDSSRWSAKVRPCDVSPHHERWRVTLADTDRAGEHAIAHVLHEVAGDHAWLQGDTAFSVASVRVEPSGSRVRSLPHHGDASPPPPLVP